MGFVLILKNVYWIVRAKDTFLTFSQLFQVSYGTRSFVEAIVYG